MATEPERSISWNVSGPAGSTGAPGPTGAPGAPGGSGPAGPATTIAAGRTLTLAGGQVITVGGGPTLTVLTRPGTRPVATLTIGSGSDALTSDVLNTSIAQTGSGGGAGSSATTSRRVTVHDITITKKIDKASPKLYSACVTGKHFPTATLTFRKAGRVYLVFRFKLVAVKTVAYDQSGGATPDEAITLNFASQRVATS